MLNNIKISDYDYPLPGERIAKYPLEHRDGSKLLVYKGGEISQTTFSAADRVLPEGSLLVFNDTRVIRARIIMHKPSGARIEIFCLGPHTPADYERAFAVKGECVWHCITGNSKKWKDGPLTIDFDLGRMQAYREGDRQVRFVWDADLTFGQLLEHLGRTPIPPYLGRESEAIDDSRYQTVYSRFEGSVAAPTAGLHFTQRMIERMAGEGFGFETVTLHVGAGTFLPVKSDNVCGHPMHTEHFDITLRALEHLLAESGMVTAVGTTTVRTLESLCALAWRVKQNGDPDTSRAVGQWEPYDIPHGFAGHEALSILADHMRRHKSERIKAATQIMIMPGYVFRIVNGIITNFHQPRSTLLLLVSAFIGGHWRKVYKYALDNGFRFLSYGDSSLLMP